MSAYGYLRPTTPFIDQRIEDGNVIKFTNVFSNHTHSNPTLSLLLTQANQYNDMEWFESPSIMNLTTAAGIESSWFTNHRLLGGWSNHITSIAKDANTIQTINNRVGLGNTADRYDGALLPLWRDALAKHPNQASFLHFYNSHLDYCARYPESSIQFSDKDILSRALFGAWFNHRKVGRESLNCYDNSIFYTDQLLEEVIQDLDGKDCPAVLVYVSDHADDVLQARFHNSVLFTHAMTTIPLFVWANEAWQQKHADLWSQLQANKDTTFTNDFMFESIVGLMGISEDSINQIYDFSAAEFNPPRALKTIHGRRSIQEANNWRYWQTKNIQTLLRKNYTVRAINIDSAVKATLAIDLGFDSLQINAQYSNENGFQLTDAQTNKIGIDLEAFLQSFDNQKIKSIVVSLDKPNPSNHAEAQVSLDTIAKLYPQTINIQSNDSKSDNKEFDLSSTNLLKSKEVREHNKSTPLLLKVTSQFDFFEEFMSNEKPEQP